MTDAVSIDKPVQPIPPAPEAVAVAEAAAPGEQAAAPVTPEANGRALPEIEFPVGSTRQAVLDHLIDSVDAGPQSVAQILAAMPAGTSRNTAESAIKREFDQGRIIRTSPGHYALAPARPVGQPKPAPPPEPDMPEDEWFAVFDAWVNDPESWDREKLGPRPNEAGHHVPMPIEARFADRVRKRQERRKEAEAAVAKRAAADAELRAKLLAATGGNYTPGPGIDDLAPIKRALELVPLDRILSAIRCKTDKKLYPKNEPATSWREPRLLREIAESYSRAVVIPSMVDAWSKATAKAPATKAQSSPPAGDMPDDIDELRRHHDDPHAPPGPHSLPGAAPPAPDVPMPAPDNLADAPEAPADVEVSPEPERAPAAPPGSGIAPFSDSAAEPGLAAALASDLPVGKVPEVAAAPVAPPDDGKPVVVGREQVLAAFGRSRIPPPPATPQPRPVQRQAEPADRDFSEEAWDEFCAGYRFNTLKWNVRRLGPEPGHPDCRAPRNILRSFGLA